MPNSVESVFIVLLIVGALVYFYLEDQRLDTVLHEQQQDLEQVSGELQATLDQILADLQAGKLTQEQASELMREAAEQAQAQNLETLERAMDAIVPEN